MAQPLGECTILSVEQMADAMKKTAKTMVECRRQPSICRVLASVRNQDPTAYDPQVVSIGPFHRGNPRLSSSEDLKWQYLDDLLLRHPEADLQSSLSRIGDQLENIKRQYSEGFPDIKDAAFVKMMVLDGCFILELMIKLVENTTDSESFDRVFSFPGGKWYLPALLSDLLLLENQIPFFVLENLFDAIAVKKILDRIRLIPRLSSKSFTPSSVSDLAYCMIIGDAELPPPGRFSDKEFLHLLHLHHSSYIFFSYEWLGPAAYEGIRIGIMEAMSHFASLVCSCVFYSALRLFLCRTFRYVVPSESPGVVPRFIPSATKQRETGVRFKKGWGRPREMLRMSIVDGCIEIPFLSLHDGSNSELRNLLAFEQSCHGHGISNEFTSYCSFMSCLLVKEEDVDVLKESGILECSGGGSEVVALFDRVAKGICLEESRNTMFAAAVREYCRCRMDDRLRARLERWRAGLVRDYFSSPWSVISLVAATVLLVLTVIQTIYTVYSYYRS